MYKNFIVAAVLLVLPLGCTHATENSAENKVTAQSPGKPAHPLQVKAVTTAELKAGVESEAKLVVSSSRDVESMEVTVNPASGMVLQDVRFQRDKRELTDREVEFPLRFRPATDGPQMIEVYVRATDATGRVMSRTVKVSLDNKPAGEGSKQPRVIKVPEDLPEPKDDAVLKAEQDVRGKN